MDAVKVDAETFVTLGTGPFLIMGSVRGMLGKEGAPDSDTDYTNEHGVWEYPEGIKYRGPGVKKALQGYIEFRKSSETWCVLCAARLTKTSIQCSVSK